MDKLYITGFDSAWGGTQKGAICDLSVDRCSGEVGLENVPEVVTWDDAVRRANDYAKNDHHVIAIDQGLIVPNMEGMRPVELKIAKALGSMHCSAYPSNTSNLSCFGKDAGIWKFQSAIQGKSFQHKPMSIPKSEKGKFYFECYPHPSIIALMNREMILKYKCRHRNQKDWNELLDCLRKLPIVGLPEILEQLSLQNKGNEDKLDSIVCAWTAYLWWKDGTERSLMVGSMSTGYLVTPCTATMRTRLCGVFGTEVNDDSGEMPQMVDVADAKPQISNSIHRNAQIGMVESSQARIDSDWSAIVDLYATDTSNLSKNIRVGGIARTLNPWMTNFVDRRLLIKFVEEDGEPEVAFVPHSHSDNQKTMMADQEGQPGVWFQLVAGASKKNMLHFRVKYRYLPLN